MAKYCRFCGAALPEDAAYCPRCGKPISPEDPVPPGEKAGHSVQPGSPQKTRQPAPTGKPTVSPVPKKKGSTRGISLLLALILVVELAVAGFRYPGFLLPSRPDFGKWKPFLPSETTGSVQMTATPERSSGTDESAQMTAAPELPLSVTDPAESPEDDEEEEEFNESDLYHTGTAGVDYAAGQGPGTPGYQSADGYGAETVIVYTASEIAAAPAVTADISAEQPVARLEGMTVDFGEDNLNHQTGTLTVRFLPDRVDPANGYSAVAWDLDLSGQDEFDYPVAVTVPYGDLGGRDPASAILPQHYNESLGRWEYVSYEIHPESGTVTAYLTHFSPFSLFTFLFGEESEEKDTLTSAQSRMLRLTTMPEEIKNSILANEELQHLLEKDFSAIIAQAQSKPSDLYQKGGVLDLLFRNLGNCFDATSLTASFAEYFEMLKPPTAGCLSAIGLTYLTYSTGKKATEQYLRNKGGIWEKTGESASTILKASPGFIAGLLGVKSASDALVGTAPLWYTEPGLLLIAGSVLLVYGLIEANAEEIKEVPEARLDRVYRSAPYRDLYWNKRTHEIIAIPNEWIDTDYIDVRIQRKQRQGLEPTDDPDPDSTILVSYGDQIYKAYYTREFLEVYENFRARKQALAEEGTRQAGVYWVDNFNIVPLGALYEDTNDWWNPGWRAILNDIRETRQDDPESWYPTLREYLEKADEAAFEFAYDLGIFTGYPVTNPTVTSADIIGDLLARLEKRQIFRRFNEACFAAFDVKNIRNWQKMKLHQNREIRFRLQDKNGEKLTFNDTRFADKYILFDTAPEHYVLSDPWTADLNSSEFLTCTYNGYLMAGSPGKLLVYESKQAYQSKEEPTETIPLKKVGENSKTVTLRLSREKRPSDTYRFKEAANHIGEESKASAKSILENLMYDALENGKIHIGKDGTFSFHGSAEDAEEGEIYYEYTQDPLGSRKTGYWSKSSHEYTLSLDLSGKLDRYANTGSCTIRGTMTGWAKREASNGNSTANYSVPFEGSASEVKIEQTKDGEWLMIGFIYRENDKGNTVYDLTGDGQVTYSDSDKVTEERINWFLRMKFEKEP